MNAANKQKLRVSTKRDDAFIARGNKNWKRGTTGFKTHESSECHREAIEVIELPRKCADIREKLSAYHSEEKSKNRQIFLTIWRNIRFLARQGLALHGSIEEESNFIQLLKLEGEVDSQIEKWLKKKSGKYTHPEIQNECLQLMSLTILREISKNIQNSVYYTIMADEVTDSSNKEQFVVCLRWVDHDLVTHEEPVGLYAVDNITSETLVNSLKDVLLRMGLSVQNCRGQCYDGANNMVGCKSGVATQIQKKEPRAILTHCYGHSLQLAVGDMVREVRNLRDALDTTSEISKLLKYSPKRDRMFEKLKAELAPETPGFRVLCPTR